MKGSVIMESKNLENRQMKTSGISKNRTIKYLIILALCLLSTFLLTKVSHIFDPVTQFLGIVGMPIVISGLFYYILNPVVNALEEKGIHRNIGILLLFVLFLGLITLGILVLIPKIENQFNIFLEDWPMYWKTIEIKTNDFFKHPIFQNFSGPIEDSVTTIFNAIAGTVRNITKNAFSGIGSVVGKFTNVLVTVVTVPFLLFYLLKDGSKIALFIESLLPTKIRQKTMTVLKDVNDKLSTYVRGQITVAFIVAILFIIGFSLIGLKYSMTLGLLAGLLNLIPYVGSALATIPAILLALVDGPKMLVAVIIVFVLEQLIEGRLVSPLILGSQLDIHPITIIFVLLSAGKIFGVMGVVLGIPIYVSIKVIVVHFFDWYKNNSGLYEERNS